MSRAERVVRRNRVDERLAMAIAGVAGGIALLSGAAPTAVPIVDLVLVFVSVGAVVWASASAPWWASAGAAGFGAVIALDPVVAAVGSVGFVGGLAIGARRQDLGGVRSVIGAIAANVLIRSELDGFFGLSAIVGIGCGLALLVVGVRRRPSGVRRIGWRALGSVGAGAAVAILLAALVSVIARPPVTEAGRSARQAVNALNEGDYERAAALFESSGAGLRRAGGLVGGPLALPARLVPGVSQNLGAGANLSAEAADAMSEAARSLRQIEPATFGLSGGKIDLEAVAAAEEPLQRVQDALGDLRDLVSDTDSPWIIAPVRAVLDEMQADFGANEERLQNAIDAVRLAPAMLGGEDDRSYLILFTTPAEARGLGGFVGYFGEVKVVDGAVSIVRFDRRSRLEEANSESPAFCTACDPELLERYGSFGFDTGRNGAFGPRGWSNVTMPAHFPYIAEAVQSLYPSSGGNPIDGVIVMDPFVIQALMQFVGPIDVDELGTTVQPDNAADFILRDQYLLAADENNVDINNAERIDALGTLGDQVILGLLTRPLPDPPTLARALGPLVAERRLLMWTDVAQEQRLLDRIGLLGSIPDLDPVDGGFSVSVTNASANKIDVFLEREVTTSISLDGDGTRRLVADVTLTNNAPESGLPRYVIGNRLGKPDGFSRLFVTFYGPPAVRQITLDGDETAIERLTEAGWTTYSQYVDLLPGSSATYHLEFALPPSTSPAVSGGGTGSDPVVRPTIWEQPLATR